MKQNLVVKYISIIFLIATFMSSMHYHNDMHEHNDCKICTVQHNVADIDTPTDVNYLSFFTKISETTFLDFQNLQTQKIDLTFSARAPPFLS